LTKQTFLGFIIVFVIIIVVVSVYYKFDAKEAIEPDFENEIVTNSPLISSTPAVTEDNSSSNNSSDNNSNSNDTDSDVNTISTNTYTFTNEFGSGDKTTTVKAIQVEKLSGFSGASNNVFYIDGRYDLYYLELTNLVKTKLASNVNHFDVRDGKVTAYFKRPHDVYEENRFVTYKELS
jgi:hypothetical protein